MPRPIQTLHLADVLTRMFRLPGKAKLEMDEQVIAIVGVDVTEAPFVADGRHYFAAHAAVSDNAGFMSHAAIINPRAGDGVVVIDRIVVRSNDSEIRIGYGANNIAAGSRVFSTMIPFRQDVAGVRQLPPLVAQNNTAGPFGSLMLRLAPTFETSTDPTAWTPGIFTYVIDGPFILPGRVAREELVVRSNVVLRTLTANFFGRWYPGIKASELL